MNSRTAFTVAGFVVLVLGALWWMVTLYSSATGTRTARHRQSHPAAYDSLALHAVALGLRGDSSGIAALSRGSEPAGWMMMAVRADSALVRDWTRPGGDARSTKAADTTFLYWSTKESRARCSDRGELTVGIVGGPVAPRIARLSASCVQIAPITFEISSPK